MTVVKTKKGTDLPLLNLKGKDYLAVQYRLVWFREDHPDWSIETSFLSLTGQDVVARAEVKTPEGRIVATAHKTETAQGFPDFVEKAETGAIGRALALIGYGTQFTDDLDEKDRIVDAPVAPRPAQRPQPQQKPSIGPTGPTPPPQGELQPLISPMRTPGAMPTRS